MAMPTKYNLCQCVSQCKEYANERINVDTGGPLEYWQLINMEKYRAMWQHSFANELGGLMQGVQDI